MKQLVINISTTCIMLEDFNEILGSKEQKGDIHVNPFRGIKLGDIINDYHVVLMTIVESKFT